MIGVRKNYDGITAGHYHLTGTVRSDRANLFNMEPGMERHICTLVSGSVSKVSQFDDDCERIVQALASHDASIDLLETLKDVTRMLEAVRLTVGLGRGQIDRLEKAQAVIAKSEGVLRQ